MRDHSTLLMLEALVATFNAEHHSSTVEFRLRFEKLEFQHFFAIALKVSLGSILYCVSGCQSAK
jgi:hypothetical protein